MRKIRNKLGKSEPILEKISDIYAHDIYGESGSNPTSRSEYNTQTDQFIKDMNPGPGGGGTQPSGQTTMPEL